MSIEGKLKRIRFRKDGKIDFETDNGIILGCTLKIDKEKKKEL